MMMLMSKNNQSQAKKRVGGKEKESIFELLLLLFLLLRCIVGVLVQGCEYKSATRVRTETRSINSKQRALSSYISLNLTRSYGTLKAKERDLEKKRENSR